MTLRFRYESAMPYITEESLAQYQPMVSAVHQILHERRGPGRDYLGWLDWPSSCGYQELQHIEKLAERIRHHSEALVVIGIGGSYIGSRAAIQVFTHHFHNQLPPSKRTAPQIYYVGHHLSSTYMADLLDVLAEKEFSINVISKSGTTIEPALAFRLFHQLIVKKYGPKGAKERILVTTDRERGALRRLAEEKGYPTFVIPDNIGGRYSVLTAVGLFPMAVAGIDIHEVLAGAREAEAAYADGDLEKNPSYQYAVIRNELYRQGKWLELLVYHEPSLIYLAEWWKQLFGESEGKDGKGIYPASVQFTTDLHALGQYIQSGRRQLFETMIQIEAPRKELTIPDDDQNLDELNYLAGRSIHYVSQQALAGSMLAHSDGGVPSLQIHLRSLNPFSFGHLVYFFQKACALSGYLLGVNPFDQPGVEAYKRNMFALLGRPGYEQEKERLESRLSRHFPGDG